MAFFTKPASEFIRRQIEERHNLKLETSKDDQLGVCGACDCPLKLKMHPPIKVIRDHIGKDAIARLDPRCWIPKEPVEAPARLLVVLPVCLRDWQLMIKNLEWMHELDGRNRFDALISYDAIVTPDIRAKVGEAAVAAFNTVQSFEYPTAPRPVWPQAANWAFQHTARYVASKARPWFWMEADCTPTRKGWLESWASEYEACGKPMMGAVVDDAGGFCAGTAVYPANFATWAPKAMAAVDTPWDWEVKGETILATHRANHLLQYIWTVKDGEPMPGGQGPAPTFKNLDWLDPNAVLFHRCKDGSLIDLLRSPSKERVILQLGKTGDIINILPVAKKMAEETGHPTRVIVHRAYLPLVQRTSYAKAVPWNGSVEDGVGASKLAGDAEVLSAMYFGNLQAPTRRCANFIKDQWAALGYEWDSSPVVFDRRNPVAESSLKKSLKAEGDYIVLSLSGISTPGTPAQIKAVTDFVSRLGIKVIDISNQRVANFVDCLALLEDAKILVAADTGIIHLNRATSTPCIHFGRSDWYGSGNVKNVVFHTPWASLPGSIPQLRKAIQTMLKPAMPLVRFTEERIETMAIMCYMPPANVGYPHIFRKHIQERRPDSQLVMVEADALGPVTGKNSYEISSQIMDRLVRNYVPRLNSRYVMFLEPDCRVGKAGWDKRIFQCANVAGDFACYGTPVAFNAQLKDGLLASIASFNLTMGTHIKSLSGEWLRDDELAWFPNGALAIYNRRLLMEAWLATEDLKDKPWDMRIGMGMHRLLGEDYFKQFVLSSVMLSFNGECFTNREYQKRKLVLGEVEAIHNIKDTWVP